MSSAVTIGQRCAECDTTVRPVLYGLPTYEAFEAAERGEFHIGGCLIGSGPDARCDCGTLEIWREQDAAPFDF